MQKLKANLRNKIKAFKGGCISSKIQEWENIIYDKITMETVKGLKSDFVQKSPSQKTGMMSCPASKKVMGEINKLIGKSVTEYTEQE